jgi:nucleoside-diphosphate-sugar epimerase
MAAESVLVTGGTGFLGGAIVRRLLDRGSRVRSLARHRSAELERLGVTQICADVADGAAVDRACAGVELVFHTAARAGVWGAPEDFWRSNVIGTRNVLDACRRHGVGRLVHTSSPSVVFDGRDMENADERAPYPRRHPAPYPATKAEAERRVRQAAASGVAAVILRPHLIWGPGDNHLVPRILNRAKRLRRVGRSDKRVDTTYIDNAAAAHLLAADRLAENRRLSGRIYFISQGEPIPLWHMVDAILAAAGLPPVRGGRVPFPLALAAGAMLEWSYRLLRIAREPPMTRFVARELAHAHWFNLAAARAELGYRPEVSIAEGLTRLSRWLMEGPPRLAR